MLSGEVNSLFSPKFSAKSKTNAEVTAELSTTTESPRVCTTYFVRNVLTLSSRFEQYKRFKSTC